MYNEVSAQTRQIYINTALAARDLLVNWSAKFEKFYIIDFVTAENNFFF